MSVTDEGDDDVTATLAIAMLGASISLGKIMQRDDADDICHKHLPIVREIAQAIERLERAVEKGAA